MAAPIWITPAGTLGSYGATKTIVPIELEATPVIPATSVTYALYGTGGLPQGLVLATDGTISGTPVLNDIGTTFQFTVKATDNFGNSSNRNFSITVVSASPEWVTPEGLLGTYTALQNITPITLQANPVIPSTTIVYSISTGSLPAGLTLSRTGKISGIPQFVRADAISEFTVVAIDNNGNSSKQTFSINIINPSPVWITPTGTLGTFPSQTTISTIALKANPVAIAATSITYKLISGKLPTGLSLNNAGLITGTPTDVVEDTTYSFVVRATDNLGNIRDRSFTMSITGNLAPTFVTPAGTLFEIQDSLWVEYKVLYDNPDPNNNIIITLVNGSLPPGLELNEVGLIRGYPEPPTVTTNLTALNAVATATSTTNNSITCLTTSGFVAGRPITFSGTLLGGLVEGVTYYIKSVLTTSTFTVSESINGSVVLLNDDAGIMNCVLPATTQGSPTNKIFSFTLKINSILGTQLRTFSIKIINQNAPISIGGPGKSGDTRVPVIYNTRPFTFNVDQDVSNYGFYVLPPATEYGIGGTYPITADAFLGTFTSGNYFAFKILGYDFDNNELEYVFDIPPILNLQADGNTGWIRGNLTIAPDSISPYTFSVGVRKKLAPTIASDLVTFSLFLSNNINGDITWVTESALGTIYNGTPSILQLEAACDVPLIYEIIDGELPNNLTLLTDGKIIGTVAFETTDDYLPKNELTSYTFTVRAYSTISPSVITSTKNFTLYVKQEFIQPTDSLYIECQPSIENRYLINNLLTDTTLIPNNYLYRPEDPNFGKAQNVTYAHAYGIYASNLPEYIEAVQKNHYWRNITLGQIKTAYAKNDKNEIVYEVVYSEVIDNLRTRNITTVYAGNFIVGKSYTIKNPGTTKWTQIGSPNNNVGTTFTATGKGAGTGSATTIIKTESVSKEIYWPRFIDLNLGPWYTSITDIYTSYIFPVELDLITQGALFYITTQEGQNLATNQGSPTFYTSLTPGYARVLYPNSLQNMRERVEEELGADNNSALLPLWMTSQQRDGSTLGFTSAWVIAYCKPGTVTLPDGTTGTYAEYVQYQIEKNWKDPIGNNIRLNLINFQIDKFAVNKSLTWNYDNTFTPPAWTGLPSGTPVPDPIDSKDFYVLFPRKTILPTKTQYPR